MTASKVMGISFDDVVYETMFFIFAIISIIVKGVIYAYDFWISNKETFYNYVLLAKDSIVCAAKYLLKYIPIFSKKLFKKIFIIKNNLKYFFINSFLFRKNIIDEMKNEDDLGGEEYSEYLFGPVSFETLSYYYSN